MSRLSPKHELGVIIVNFRLANYIAALLEGGALRDYRVLLIDNGSEPDLISALAQEYGTDVLLLPTNVGFASAVNIGLIELPDCRNVLLLNPDLTLAATDVTGLLAALERDNYDAVTPLLLDGNGKIQVGTAGGPVTSFAFGAYFLFLSHAIGRVRGIFYTRRQLQRGRIAPAWICMACLLARRDAFSRFGPVPEDELVYGEDVAWGTTATAMGARLGVVKSINVVHQGGAAGGRRGVWDAALIRLLARRRGRIAGKAGRLVLVTGLWTRGLIRRLLAVRL